MFPPHHTILPAALWQRKHVLGVHSVARNSNDPDMQCLLMRAALATEMPMPELLLEKPHGRNEPLISHRMWKHVVVQGLYQLFWLFLIIYGAPAQLPAFAVRCTGPIWATCTAGHL